MIASAVDIGVGIAAGAGLGFLLVVVVMSLWERFSDPRVRDSASAYAATGIPSSRFVEITGPRGVALLRRWRALSSKPSTRVALIPTSARLEPVASEAAEWLSALHRKAQGPQEGEIGQQRASQPAGTEAAAPPPPGRASWRRWQVQERHGAGVGAQDTARLEPIGAGHRDAPPASHAAGELLVVAASTSDPESTPEAEAMRSDVVVLLIDTHLRTKTLIDSVLTLEQFGHRPEWTLLVDSPRKSRRAMKRAGAG